MLLTRCPDCGTTFRITTDALQKADGQVRCGRCSNIFNAHANLQERDEPARGRVAGPVPASGTQAQPTLAQTAPPQPAAPAALEAIAREEGEDADDDADESEASAPIEHESSTSSVAETLGDGEPPLSAISVWTPEEVVAPPRHTRKWRIASALAGLLLVGQLVHHYRAELVRQPALGPALKAIYAWFGETLLPRWDVGQYEVVYTGATAEPKPSGQGNLVVTARIRNKGPNAQPYPHVRLALLDRWESAVGSRIFRPNEYLPATISGGTMMAAGETVEAQFVVVDPGPDAYGFELDVCSEVNVQLVCAGDNVFK